MTTAPQPIRKAPKDNDLSGILYFLRVSGLAVPILSVLGLYVGYTHYGMSGALLGVLLALAGGALLSFGAVAFLNAIGGAAGRTLFAKKRAVWTPREQVQGLLRQARLNRDNQEFQTAFDCINQVLAKDPDYPEALLLKAQILWHGYEDAASAKRFLAKVLSLADTDQTAKRHAASLLAALPESNRLAGSHAALAGIEAGLSKPRIALSRRLALIIFQDVKEKTEATPGVLWVVGVSIVFAFLCLLSAAVLNVQLDRLESVGRTALRSVEKVHRETLANARGIQQAQTSLQDLVSPVLPVGRAQDKAP